jgi:hypothetical protein
MTSHQRPLGITRMYDILSLMNSTLLIADMILFCTKKPVPNSWFNSPFHRKMYIRLRVQCHLRPIWPLVLPLNLTYILRFLPPLPWANLPYTHFWTVQIPNLIHFLSLRSFIQGIHPGPRLFEDFRNKLIFYGEELLAPRQTPKLGDHPLLAVRDYLFNIFAATLHTWRLSPPSATWGLAMPW